MKMLNVRAEFMVEDGEIRLEYDFCSEYYDYDVNDSDDIYNIIKRLVKENNIKVGNYLLVGKNTLVDITEIRGHEEFLRNMNR